MRRGPNLARGPWFVDRWSTAMCNFPGTCVDEPAGYTCACEALYSGALCESPVDPCDVGGACQNGAYCCSSVRSACAADLPPGYTECYCPHRYTGQTAGQRDVLMFVIVIIRRNLHSFDNLNRYQSVANIELFKRSVTYQQS